MPPAIPPPAKLFDACADAYAQYRPTYPEAAIETLLAGLDLPAEALVCDLGAGPGRLSFLLAQRGIRLVAIEPLAEMRARGAQVARERHLSVDFAAGRAEAIPLRDQSVEAVVCGQAFHWFETNAALGEIHRLLRPGGGLALLWNNRDWQHIIWLAELEQLMMKYNPRYHPTYRSRDWSRILNASQFFTPVERFEFWHDQYVGADEVLGLIDSFSYVRVIPPASRQQLKQEVASMLERAQTAASRRWLLRYRTELYLARKGGAVP